jgi:hypothetical protein
LIVFGTIEALEAVASLLMKLDRTP